MGRAQRRKVDRSPSTGALSRRVPRPRLTHRWSRQSPHDVAPSSQMSPGLDIAVSASSGTSSSWTNPVAVLPNSAAKSCSLDPSIFRSAPSLPRSVSSSLSISASHPALSAMRLSASMSSLRSSSFRFLSRITGTCDTPSSRAAARRPCPATTSASSPTRSGFVKPKVRILPAISAPGLGCAFWRCVPRDKPLDWPVFDVQFIVGPLFDVRRNLGRAISEQQRSAQLIVVLTLLTVGFASSSG